MPAPEDVQVLETSLMELSPATAPLPDLSSVLGIPAPRRYVEDDGPEWRELDYLVEVERKIQYVPLLENKFIFRLEHHHLRFVCFTSSTIGMYTQARPSQKRYKENENIF